MYKPYTKLNPRTTTKTIQSEKESDKLMFNYEL